MRKQARLAIVIPTWNDAEGLRATLQGLSDLPAAVQDQLEVVVVELQSVPATNGAPLLGPAQVREQSLGRPPTPSEDAHRLARQRAMEESRGPTAKAHLPVPQLHRVEVLLGTSHSSGVPQQPGQQRAPRAGQAGDHVAPHSRFSGRAVVVRPIAGIQQRGRHEAA